MDLHHFDIHGPVPPDGGSPGISASPRSEAGRPASGRTQGLLSRFPRGIRPVSPRRTGRATPVASGSTDTLRLGWLVPSPSPGWWPGFPGAEPCLNHVRHTLCVSDDYGKNVFPMPQAYRGSGWGSKSPSTSGSAAVAPSTAM